VLLSTNLGDNMNYWNDDEIYDGGFEDEDDIFDDDLDDDEKGNQKSDSKIVCEYCGIKGHTSLDCPSIED
jgi:hypothetical protein